MADEWQKYLLDKRTVCKYGIKCYQKNPEHHKTYKHPPEKKTDTRVPTKNRYHPYSRKKHNIHKNGKTDQTKNEVTDKTDNKEPKVEVEEKPTSSTINNNAKLIDEEQTFEIKLPENILMYDKDADHAILKDLFLVEMPQDFFRFFKCLKNDNEAVEKTLANVNLELIGPYDLLLGKLPVLDDKELYLIHWRFFYDPPEFQAVIKKKGDSQFHIGYFRDDPNQKPVFLASNDSAKDCHITPLAENIFAAIYFYLQNDKNQSPFTSVASKTLMKKIKTWAEEYNFPIEEYDMKKRLSKAVTKTFHGAGIVVPNGQSQYRPLVESDAKIKKMFATLEAATTQNEQDKILSELQPVITYANIAVDECDFGTGLELGIDLFCSGLKVLHESASNSLCAVYSLLNREAFIKIIQVHLKYRRKGPNMSLLSLSASN